MRGPYDFQSTQIFEEASSGSLKNSPVGRPMMHLSGKKHTTGEAIFSGDLVNSGLSVVCRSARDTHSVADCLHMAFVLSTETCGAIESVDTSEALAQPGVVGYVDHTDMPGSIHVGLGETLVFAAGRVG